MKLASDQAAGFWAPGPPALDAVLARLDRLSLKAELARQREVAIARALKPYLTGDAGRVLAPLPQEAELASLFLFCDFYPEDGQLTLIEQLRDVITEHIPNEERVWLDPLKHSYIDLLELTAQPTGSENLKLRSIGDGTSFFVPGGDFSRDFMVEQVLLTRVVRDPESYESGNGVFAGCGIVLSLADARAIFEATAEQRREMEMASGSFALGEWQEFAKRFGHMVLWNFAELRMSALIDAVTHIQYRTSEGQPCLYALALYDHHDYQDMADGLSAIKECEPEPTSWAEDRPGMPANTKPVGRWRQREDEGNATVARLTLTSTQLTVECDSPERMDVIKHRLASSFGFSLHFRGESLAPPARRLSVSELTSSDPLVSVVTPEEDQALLTPFLEHAYLEWSDQVHHALGGQTPRHAAVSPATRGTVSALIDEMERNDPGLRRTGKMAYNYNTLRAHVGLDESP